MSESPSSGEISPGARRGVDPLPQDPDGLICSARGCSHAARFDLQWNNAKIHTPDRRKRWLACAQHRESLAGFLTARGFLKDVERLPGLES